MAFLIKNQNHKPIGTSGNKEPGGLFLWLKKVTRWGRKQKSALHNAQVKHDINRLEKERAKEHNALLRQRKFYESLIRHPEKVITQEVIKKDEPKIIKEVELKKEVKAEPKINFDLKVEPKIEVEKEPELKTEIQPEPKPEIKIEPRLAPEPIVRDVKPIAPEPRFEETLLKKETIVEKIPELKPNSAPIKKSAPSWLLRLKKGFAKSVAKSSLVEKLARERSEEAAVQNKDSVEERFWQPYNSAKANLIKDQGVLFFNWQQKILTLGLSLILCSLAIGLVYVGLLVWEQERLNDNKSTLANFEAINAEVTKNEKDLQEIVNFNKKLDIVNFILTNHIYWTNYLAFLEANTLKDVYFERFSGDLSGKYSIQSVARNFDAISLQLEVMKAYNMMRSIQYTGAQTVMAGAGASQTVKFNLEMSVDPKIFTK